MSQLSLFPPLSVESANTLLDLLNEGRKRDLFEPIDSNELSNGYLILSAVNKECGILFNIVDREGKTPPDFSANWRIAAHIINELEREKK